MTTDLDLIESRDVRDRSIGRVEVLDKVKALRLLPGDVYATTEIVASYYEVEVETVKKTVQRSLDEFTGDGFRVLRGAELRDIKSLSGLSSHTPSLAVFPRRAVLRAGMLLRDSDVAKRVRTYLLDVEEKDSAPQFVVPQTFAEALELAARQAREIEAKDEKITALEPKAQLAENYLSVPTNGRLLREIAKSFALTESVLRALLVDKGVIFRRYADCGATYWDAKAEHCKGAHPKFRPRETRVDHGVDSICLHYTLYVLPAGVELINRIVTGRKTPALTTGTQHPELPYGGEDS